MGNQRYSTLTDIKSTVNYQNVIYLGWVMVLGVVFHLFGDAKKSYLFNLQIKPWLLVDSTIQASQYSCPAHSPCKSPSHSKRNLFDALFFLAKIISELEKKSAKIVSTFVAVRTLLTERPKSSWWAICAALYCVWQV